MKSIDALRKERRSTSKSLHLVAATGIALILLMTALALYLKTLPIN